MSDRICLSWCEGWLVFLLLHPEQKIICGWRIRPHKNPSIWLLQGTPQEPWFLPFPWCWPLLPHCWICYSEGKFEEVETAAGGEEYDSCVVRWWTSPLAEHSPGPWPNVPLGFLILIWICAVVIRLKIVNIRRSQADPGAPLEVERSILCLLSSRTPGVVATELPFASTARLLFLSKFLKFFPKVV